jgi:hypothetical protein
MPFGATVTFRMAVSSVVLSLARVQWRGSLL